MLRTVFLTALSAAIAILGGAGSVWYMLGPQHGIGALAIGPWTSFPNLGSPNADPYSRARVARDGELTLGRAEGLIFTATTDSAGAALRRECRYVVEGVMPPARFWTLHAADDSLSPLPPHGKRRQALHSMEVLRLHGNVVSIAFGNSAASGNWIATGGSGPMAIVLTLYDTQVAGGSVLADIAMPQVIRQGCDA